MLGAPISELFSVRPVDAILFASGGILPSICIGYLRQTIASQRISLDFSLRRLESIELNRATLLYERVCNNLKEIDRRCRRALCWNSMWLNLQRHKVIESGG